MMNKKEAQKMLKKAIKLGMQYNNTGIWRYEGWNCKTLGYGLNLVGHSPINSVEDALEIFENYKKEQES